MEKRKLGLWVPIAVIAAALLMLAVSTGTVDAAPRAGRGGGKGHGGTTSSAVLTVTPNPVPLGATSVVIKGSGFAANSAVWLTTSDLYMPMVFADASGAFSYTYQHTFWIPGPYSYQAWDMNGTSKLLATANFSVCSTSTC